MNTSAQMLNSRNNIEQKSIESMPEYKRNYINKLTLLIPSLTDTEKLICCSITFLEEKDEITKKMGFSLIHFKLYLDKITQKFGYCSANKLARDLIVGEFMGAN